MEKGPRASSKAGGGPGRLGLTCPGTQSGMEGDGPYCCSVFRVGGHVLTAVAMHGVCLFGMGGGWRRLAYRESREAS
jgi:hypothetical protein